MINLEVISVPIFIWWLSSVG